MLAPTSFPGHTHPVIIGPNHPRRPTLIQTAGYTKLLFNLLVRLHLLTLRRCVNAIFRYDFIRLARVFQVKCLPKRWDRGIFSEGIRAVALSCFFRTRYASLSLRFLFGRLSIIKHKAAFPAAFLLSRCPAVSTAADALPQRGGALDRGWRREQGPIPARRDRPLEFVSAVSALLFDRPVLLVEPIGTHYGQVLEVDYVGVFDVQVGR